LIPIKLWHQNVTKNELRLVVIHLGQCIKTVIRQQDFVPSLLEKNLCASANGIAVIHHEHFESCACCSQLSLLPMEKTNNAATHGANAPQI
jgi:isocitrate dehydrogenase kinase/phosphatase